jgi:hypothetical protein
MIESRRIMTNPPTNSATANCHPRSVHSTSPSSITRFVLANMKTIAVVKSAPFTIKLLAIALAAYEQLELIMPRIEALTIVRGRWSPRAANI